MPSITASAHRAEMNSRFPWMERWADFRERDSRWDVFFFFSLGLNRLCFCIERKEPKEVAKGDPGIFLNISKATTTFPSGRGRKTKAEIMAQD